MAATKDQSNLQYENYSNICVDYPFPGNPRRDNLPDVTPMDSYELAAKLSGSNASLTNMEFSLPEEFDENSKKETEILNMNRVKLTEYVHDCSVLHPYMKEKKIFNVADCELIQHQVTGAQRMDKFVDIVLTKGPKAIGVFHEALKKPYPYVFDILTRLFTSAGVELSESRKIIDEPFDSTEDLNDQFSTSIASGCSTSTSYSFRKGKTTTIRHTIRKHIDELTERCEVVKNQRDELQKALIQREKDINALMSHRDRVIQQKYEDMLSLLANWREIVTHQSDGNIQKMQELLSEHEGIRQDYEMLEGDYMLVVSELSAARDRIAKLLTHLQKMETEFSLAQEEKEALVDKLLAQQGEIQRLERRIKRRARGNSDDKLLEFTPDQDVKPAQHNCDCKTLEEKLAEAEEQMRVCQKERKDALEERDKLQLKLHEEKARLKKVKDDMRKATDPRALKKSISEPPGDLFPCFPNDSPIAEETVFMPVDDSGMKIGLAVVVRELTETGNASKNGVKLGDEICQVNHIKIDSDKDPLQFAERLLQSASQTVTLSIKRQVSVLSQQKPHTPLHPITPGLSYPKLPGLKATSPLPLLNRPHHLLSQIAPSSTSHSSRSHDLRDTSEDFSEEGSDTNCVFSEPELPSESMYDGFIASPQRRGSDQRAKGGIILNTINSDPGNWTVTDHDTDSLRGKSTIRGHVFPVRDLTPDGEPSSRWLQDTDYSGYTSDQKDTSASQSSPIKRLRNVKRRKPKKSMRRRPESEVPARLSRSVDDIDLMWSPRTETSVGEYVAREDGSRRVVLPSGHLGTGLSILGGRGNGLYIKSERSSSRSLKTGDRILQISRKSALKMTYAEAIELLEEQRGKECMLQVKYDKEGYSKLKASSRDNFYVKAKKSHKSHSRQELDVVEGDVFHVVDTKPSGLTDMTNMWQVEKLNSRGHIISTGCILVALESDEYGFHSLPNVHGKNLYFVGPVSFLKTGTLQSSNKNFMMRKPVSAASAFKYYRPVNKIVVSEPRPVVLMGVFDSELSECLVERGSRGSLMFAFPNRVSPNNVCEVDEQKIIERMTSPEGIMQSTIDDITEVTRNGYHCVLNLTTSCLAKPKISSLRPIVITLSPHHKTVRIKTSTGLPPCFTREVLLQDSISAVKDKIRHVHKVMVAGSWNASDIEVPSVVTVDELVSEIQQRVIEQQNSVFWEMDL